MIIKTGTYVGNGATQSIVADCAPDFLIGKAVTTNAGDVANAWAKTSTMPSDGVKELAGNATGLVTGVCTQLTGTGFDLGADALGNKSGVTYQFLAIEAEGGDTTFEVGSYNGNGVDNRNIGLAAITGTPGFVAVFGEFAAGAMWFSNVHTADRSQWFDNTSVASTNGIQSIGAGTFQVGTRDQVNRGTGTPTYHYVAIAEVAALFEVITFTGNLTDDRTLTGAGFQPTWAMTQWRDTGGTARSMALRGPGHVGDLCGLTTAVVDAANRIQMFTSDGEQVGTANEVNLNLIPYTALFFNATPVVPSASISGAVATAGAEALAGTVQSGIASISGAVAEVIAQALAAVIITAPIIDGEPAEAQASVRPADLMALVPEAPIGSGGGTSVGGGSGSVGSGGSPAGNNFGVCAIDFAIDLIQLMAQPFAIDREGPQHEIRTSPRGYALPSLREGREWRFTWGESLVDTATVDELRERIGTALRHRFTWTEPDGTPMDIIGSIKEIEWEWSQGSPGFYNPVIFTVYEHER